MTKQRSKPYIVLILLCLIALFGSPNTAVGQPFEGVFLDGKPLAEGPLDLAVHDLFADSTGKLGFEEVRQQGEFKTGDKVSIAARYSNYWIRLPLENRSGKEQTIQLIVNEYTTVARAYYLLANGKWTYSQTGRFIPVPERTFNKGYPLALKVVIPPNTSSEVYVVYRAQKGSHHQYGNIVSLSVRDGERWYAQYSASSLWQGIFHGLSWMMLIYMLFQFLLFKEKAFLIYVAYVGSISIFLLQNNGYLWQSFLGSHPKLIYQVELLIFVGGLMYFLFIAKFIQKYTYLTKLYKVLMYYVYCGGVFIFIDFILSVVNSNLLRMVEHIFSASMIFMMLYSVVVLIRNAKPHPMVWYIIIGFFSFAFGANLVLLGVFEVIAFNEYYFQIGVLVDFFMFSLGLSHSYRNQQRQEVEIQKGLVKEIESKRAEIQKINEELEDKVIERTAKIEAQKEAIKAAQDRLVESEKMASLGVLTAGIAHEINNFLTVIDTSRMALEEKLKRYLAAQGQMRGIGERLLGQELQAEWKAHYDNSKMDKQEDKLFKQLTRIKEGTEQTEIIVKGLRNYAHLDDGELIELSLNQLVEESIYSFQESFHSSTLIVKELSPNLPNIYGNRQQLIQVLLNLMRNAMDAMDATIEGTLTISSKMMADGQLELTVADTGHGISRDVAPRVFEPLYTTRTGKHTGLGLYVSYSIMQKHNGQLTFTSAAGQGTIFYLRLPTASTML